MKSDSLEKRSEFLVEVFKDYIDKDWSILEIGCGDGRNIKYLKEAGWKNVEGIDKLQGTSIEDIEPKEYDVIFTMSCLFLIPPESNWVFEKIAKMAKKYLITFEGETGIENKLWGRNYYEIFKPFGFEEIEYQAPVFNEYGVMRVLKRCFF